MQGSRGLVLGMLLQFPLSPLCKLLACLDGHEKDTHELDEDILTHLLYLLYVHQKENHELDEDMFALESAVVERQV